MGGCGEDGGDIDGRMAGFVAGSVSPEGGGKTVGGCGEDCVGGRREEGEDSCDVEVTNESLTSKRD
ncbi:hypothetical protein OSB04_005216 [Centaurea solstitialis]|uniref:Uncharacterized protein n=1 Tax=Centaurea solstitialis TaxID=347529 RepID=A0AA38TTG3_9ASTR|nr:hypothetical protein OSB04_005216 [Centaurea solstitialis]